jgi:hypothetical protein
MRLAVMQPYFLPYIGYFMLIRAVDHFVVFDDVQYIARGWINRNFVLHRGGPQAFTLPVQKAPRETLIKDMRLALTRPGRDKLLELFRHAYGKAPYYGAVRALLDEIFAVDSDRLEPFVTRSLQILCRYLGLGTAFSLSSQTSLPQAAGGKDRIPLLCEAHGATEYVNPVGGMRLYCAKTFAARNVRLRFIDMGDVCYRQFGGPFVPNLSILDTLMFNSPEDCRAQLDRYKLMAPTQGAGEHDT